ncbi:unnamed protein product [Gordionus sp. m RMFG-2023]|uniref:MAP kinase-activating death domain protein-like isoform X3 n=1 Tax=Gordionus sp. m RMFG-2023 TaxID=3053472 RepID=UPI0030DEF4F6
MGFFNDEKRGGYACPRLVDYFVIVGYSSHHLNDDNSNIAGGNINDTLFQADELNHTTGQNNKNIFEYSRDYETPSHLEAERLNQEENRWGKDLSGPSLLRRFPEFDHPDFALPLDVIYFAQPEPLPAVKTSTTATSNNSSSYNLSNDLSRKSDSSDIREQISFVFTLTDKDSGRTRFGICINYYSENQNREVARRLPTSLCLLSHYPFFSRFRDTLTCLKKIIDAGKTFCGDNFSRPGLNAEDALWNMLICEISDRENFEPMIIHIVNMIESWISRFLDAPVPIPGKTKVQITILPEHFLPRSLLFALPDSTRFSLIDFPLHLPLELLGVDTCLKVLTCIILEQKVVVQSRDHNVLTMSVLALVAMIYPMEYMFPIIPLLPVTLRGSEQLFFAPTPYFIGIPSTFLSTKRVSLPKDVWLIDLDSDKMINPTGLDLPSLPEPEGSLLRSHLTQALYSMSVVTSEPDGMNISSATSNDAKIISIHDENEIESKIAATIPTIAYVNDMDIVDMATRIAMVRFFDSPNMFAHFEDHCHILRLYPRPVVAFQIDSFIKSRPHPTRFVYELAKTQAFEFFAEWSLCPNNAAFQRVKIGVSDPTSIGDKPKWYQASLVSISFRLLNGEDKLGNNTIMALVLNHVYFRKPLSKNVTARHIGNHADEVIWVNLLEGRIVSGKNQNQNVEIAKELQSKSSDGKSIIDTSSSNSDHSLGNTGCGHKNNTTVPIASNSTLSLSSSSYASSSSSSSPFPNDSSSTPSFHLEDSKALLSVPSVAYGRRTKDKNHATDTSDTASIPPTPGLRRAKIKIARKKKIKNPTRENTISSTTSLSKNGNITSSIINRLDDNHVLNYREICGEDLGDKLIRHFSTTINTLTLPRKLLDAYSKTFWFKTRQEVSLGDILPLGGADLDSDLIRKSRKFNDERINDIIDDDSNDAPKLSLRTCKNSDNLAIHPSLKYSSSRPRLLSTTISLGGESDSGGAESGSVKSSPGSRKESGNQDRTETSARHFLSETAQSVLNGRGVGWLKMPKLRELLKQESCRLYMADKLNRNSYGRQGSFSYEEKGVDKKENAGNRERFPEPTEIDLNDFESLLATSKTDFIPEVRLSTQVWKGYLSVLRCCLSGLEFTYSNYGIGGMASTYVILEICSTHFHNPSNEKTNEDNILQRCNSVDKPDLVENLKSTCNNIIDPENTYKKISNFGSRLSTSISNVASNMMTERGPIGQNNNDNGHSNLISYSGNIIVSEHLAERQIFDRYYRKEYLYQMFLGKNKSKLWDENQFWQDIFLDAVTQERDMIGMDIGPSEMMNRFVFLSETEKKRLELEEDNLLAIQLLNLVSFTVMMGTNKKEICRKVRRLLAKSHVGLKYSQTVNRLLDRINAYDGNKIPLLVPLSRRIRKMSFNVKSGVNPSTGTMVMEICEDAIVFRTIKGDIIDRLWYDKLINMTLSPRNKVLCLWWKSGNKTYLQKFFTKKCRELYEAIKDIMERIAAQTGDTKVLGSEIGGQFEIGSLYSDEKGLLDVSLDGITIAFPDGKTTLHLNQIKKCRSEKDNKIFVLQIFDYYTQQLVDLMYTSDEPLLGSPTDLISYCVISCFEYRLWLKLRQERRERRLRQKAIQERKK